MSKHIDHYVRAMDNVDSVHEWQAQEGETDAAMLATAILAQTEATLALVKAQREANRQAALANRIAAFSSTFPDSLLSTGEWDDILADIREGLGLD